jgi:hypothetical protein
MGWGIIGDAVDAAGDLAGDVVDVVEDVVDEAGDAIEGAVDAVGDAIDDVVDTVGEVFEDIGELIEEAVDELGELAGDAWDTATDLWDQVGAAVEDAWEAAVDEVEDAWEAIEEGVEDGFEAIADVAEDAWDGFTTAVEDAWNTIEHGVEDAWDAVERLLDDAWKTLADAYDWALAALERTLEWIGELAEDIGMLFLQLGACLAGQVVYRLAKLGNVVANVTRPVRTLPESFRDDMAPIFDGADFWNVWYVDDASLTANWFSESNDTDGMTFAGVTLAGINLSYVIFLSEPWDENDPEDRKLMAHELVHVLQYRKLVTETAFACAYGAGYAKAGFDYAANPFEASAYQFVDANSVAISA